MSLGYCPEDAITGGAEGFREGWYYPGEIATLDSDGYLYLKGRVADMIRRGGVDLFPPEIEEVMASHPSVREVAVVGRPVTGMGEEVIAFVVPRGEAQHEALAEHCRGLLRPEKRPDRVFYMDSLPRLGSGKLDRGKLRKLAIQKSTQR
jgi:acyl-CoA synthetase (AMP-forming)/AMP-acid ligase II